jgi:hypothetical protein
MQNQTPKAAADWLPAELFLTEGQLADRWQCSIKKLQNDRLKGGGPRFVKIRRSVRYRFTDVLAYEEANLRTSTSDQGGA